MTQKLALHEEQVSRASWRIVACLKNAGLPHLGYGIFYHALYEVLLRGMVAAWPRLWVSGHDGMITIHGRTTPTISLINDTDREEYFRQIHMYSLRPELVVTLSSILTKSKTLRSRLFDC